MGEKKNKMVLKDKVAGVVAHHLIPALGGQRQADLCDFKVNLVYRVNSRTDKIYTEKPCLKICKNISKRNRVIKKPCKDGKHRESLDIVRCSVIFKLTAE